MSAAYRHHEASPDDDESFVVVRLAVDAPETQRTRSRAGWAMFVAALIVGLALLGALSIVLHRSHHRSGSREVHAQEPAQRA